MIPSCRQGYLLEAVVLLVWRNMDPTACRPEPNQSQWYMVLLQTGLLAGSGGVACVEEHAPEIWVLVKPKVHDTLLPTGLLAGSGGFAGVEEHAPESVVMCGKAVRSERDKASRKLIAEVNIVFSLTLCHRHHHFSAHLLCTEYPTPRWRYQILPLHWLLG
jgi:hypothetical protein